MIEVKELHKSYGTTEVLKGVNGRISKGEFITIVGASPITNNNTFKSPFFFQYGIQEIVIMAAMLSQNTMVFLT